ncbi:ATP-binding cassette domain-containing protein [Candidatus Saccharibacteria bacterium]|nr:ATP-binding cassette domain-containing protein [Candidatus Saccharibacteria bacterium]MBR6964889.1 ATP-binding cassette domain-containing protein [Candidatus Saccharibacteria bacterium]
MLELRNISYVVDGLKILDDVSLKIETGNFLAITGPNGSGKSTLAQIIMGIKKPTSGQILLNGEDITELSITDRAKKGIAFAFQQPVKFKGLTVFDLLEIASGAKLKKSSAAELLEKVGLNPEYLERELSSALSGGELKRIEIATVLTRNADLMIFDEPEAGIDLWSFEKLVDILSGLSNTAIVISHQEKLLQAANEIILLKKGKIAERGKAKDILRKLEGGKNES